MIGAKDRLKSKEGIFGKKTYQFCKECGSDETIFEDTYFDQSKYDRMNKIQNYNSNYKNRIKDAESVSLRILNYLQISNEILETEILHHYIKIGKLYPNSRNLKSVRKVIPILIYCCCKVHQIIINEENIRDVSDISKEDFDKLKFKISHLLPEYQKYRLTGKKDYVSRMLFQFIISSFENNPEIHDKFLIISSKILNTMWSRVQRKTEENIAGIIAISTYYYLEKEFGNKFGNLNKRKICDKLKAKDSTVSRALETLFTRGQTSCVRGKKIIVEKLSLMFEK